MDDTAEMITHDGEVMQMPISIGQADQSLAIAMSRVEIDHQISTARAYPRSIDRAIKNITTLTTLDEETAASCIYALPRGNKPVQGPSIRLAEVVAGQWGNCRIGTRVVHVDRTEKVVVAEGIFHDLETNVQTTARVQRRIVDKYGKLYSDDMIIVTGNAACSIAKRNAILGGVPKGIWGGAYDRAIKVVAGDIETLAVTREKAVGAFAHFGVKPEQVFGALGIEGYEDITLNHIPTLRGMFSALKNGEATVEEMFSPRVVGSGHQTVASPLADAGPTPKPASAPVPTPKPRAEIKRPDAKGAAPAFDPNDLVLALRERLATATDVAAIDAAYSELEIEAKLGNWHGFIDRARKSRTDRIAQITETAAGTPPPSQPAAPGAEASTSNPPAGEASASETYDGINPDDEIGNLIDKLAHAKDEATVEEWYVETDIEAALSGFEGYVEKARGVRDQHLQRVRKLAAAVPPADAPAPPPPPPASGLSDDEEGEEAAPPAPSQEDRGFDLQGWRECTSRYQYAGYADLLAAYAKRKGDTEIIATFWKDSNPLRTQLIPIAERAERTKIKERLDKVWAEIEAANPPAGA